MKLIGDLTNQTNQKLSEPNLLFVFIFSLLKPNQRFGGVRLPNLAYKCSQTPIALY